MIVDVGAPYRQRLEQALGDEAQRTALDRATSRLSGQRRLALEAVDNPRLRDEARAIRQSAIENLPATLEQLEANLTANGCVVHWARDAAEAMQIVREIAQSSGAQRVVKSKSMVTEEIGLNDALERIGVDVVETDLGEYIVQLANEPPSHIIAPVIHKRVEDISELFQRELGMPPTDDPTVMCAAARHRLRKEFLDADMGISGCNFAIAETGTVCIITNEGNGRMVTSMPRVYVAVAGIEKVVQTVEDAALLWQAASRNATGQSVSVYFSMSSGPRRPGHADGPEEMHVVLLDNGRARMLERGYGDAALLLADDPTLYKELPYASSLCGVCRDVCPVKIDLPRLLLDLRSDMVENGSTPKFERAAIRAYTRSVESPARFQRLQNLARMARRLPVLPPPLNKWARTRELPRVPDKSFQQLWRDRRQAHRGGSDE
jgi:L-lactate dehydrogenase complex protein LldF